MEFRTFQIPGTATHALRIKAPAQEQASRQPVHFIALVDTSGSMDGENRLINVVASLTFMLEHLTATDYLTVITFSTSATVAVTTTQLLPGAKTAIAQTLQGLVASGNTNLSAAILLARDCLASALLAGIPATKTGILILTDGHANTGLIGEAELAALLAPVAATGTTVSTIGYGTEHNSALLTQMATAGSGSYNVVNNVEDTASCIGDIIGGLLSCVAQNVVVEYPAGTTFETSYNVSCAAAAAAAEPTKRVTIGDVLAESDIYIISSAAATSVRGHLLPAGTAFAAEPVPAAEPAPAELQAAVAARIRHEVAGFLREAAAGRASASAAARIRTSIHAQMADAPDNPIWQILLNQLADVEHTSPAADPGLTTIFHQRATSIGLGRGLISGSSAVTSPFANHTQRHISTYLHSHVSQAQDPHEYESVHTSSI